MNPYRGFMLREATMIHFSADKSVGKSLFALAERYRVSIFNIPQGTTKDHRMQAVRELLRQEEAQGKATLRQIHERKLRLVFL